MNDSDAPARKRARSPSYPSIDLGRAVERAQAVYDNEGKYEAPVDSIIRGWGYKSKGGRALRQVAALKKFGLLDEQGNQDQRRLKLTDLALDILTPGSPRRLDALQTAALTPTIHLELRQRYPDGLPSESTVLFYLVRERDFTDVAARQLLAEFEATMAFAGLGNASSQADQPEAENENDDDPVENEQIEEMKDPDPIEQQDDPDAASLRSVVLPISGGAWVTVKGEFPMKADAWDQMMAMLAAMKPGLTRDDAS
jgi:hypothetical protein